MYKFSAFQGINIIIFLYNFKKNGFKRYIYVN
jgi:hypothetical protein